MRRAGNFSLIRYNLLEPGLESSSNHSPDVILLDLRLPDCGIDETLPKTLSAYPGLPIIVLSSLEDSGLARQLVQEGAQDYLCKSRLDEDLLVRTIFNARERKLAERSIRRDAELNERLREISQLGINSRKLETFLTASSKIVAETLNVDLVQVLELHSETKKFILRGGFGLRDPLGTVIEADLTGQAGFTLASSMPETADDMTTYRPINSGGLEEESRFDTLELGERYGVHSGLSSVIHSQRSSAPYGVLMAHSQRSGIFSKEDGYFLRGVANVMAASIQRYSLETRLKNKVKQLDEAHRKKDEFLSVLSHELRTPLSVIVGYAELLRTSVGEDFEFKEAIDAIERNAHAELRLVEDILDVSRIITGRLKLESAPVNLAQVVESAIDTISLSAKAKSITIHKEISDDSDELMGDSDRLRQVFWNLLANAVKFTGNNGDIYLSVKKAGSYMQVKIRDTGMGISSASLCHIFDRFWQSDSTEKRKHAGLGLGLSIVRHIVEAHGGKVTCFSEGENKGTSFFVSLPLNHSFDVDSESAELEVPVQSEQTVSLSMSEGRLKGRNILLVDDSVDLVNLISHYLKGSGATFEAVTSPLKALEMYKAGNYDVVVADIGMPEMTGYTFIQRIRSLEKKFCRQPTKAISLTAFAGESNAKLALSAGFDRFLSKPIGKAKLLDEIVQLTEKEASRPEI